MDPMARREMAGTVSTTVACIRNAIFIARHNNCINTITIEVVNHRHNRLHCPRVTPRRCNADKCHFQSP